MKKVLVAAAVLAGLGVLARLFGPKMSDIDWAEKVRGDAGQRPAEVDVPQHHRHP
jgi:hypothetical protein